MEHYERNNRPLRIAIDFSIWQFQIQSGKGGSNPELRTLYYRLLRLFSLGIQPLFVFDGPNKPPFKRNAKTTQHGASLANLLSKQLLNLFGFPSHTAPGEAEAECALLQKNGVVDAVLSEDVDTLLFGSRMTFRNWSTEDLRGNKSPTHVNVFTADAMKDGAPGLDSDGMILIALMSGGDYIPAGVPRCGIKIACEAARAGFGRDLCRLSKTNTIGFRQWRERLKYELETNESGFFRVKHKALRIPEKFPDMTVLGYYTNPAVSSLEKVSQLATETNWIANPDISRLRDFVIKAFSWDYLSGAKKFVRGLAPALLVNSLLLRANVCDEGSKELEVQEKGESNIITSICGRRSHFATDATPELRVTYTPLNIVQLDLGLEKKDDRPIEVDSESEVEEIGPLEKTQTLSTSVVKRRVTPAYDPSLPARLWVLETYVKSGVPLMVKNWEEAIRKPKKPRVKPQTSKTSSNQGSIDSFMKVSKPSVRLGRGHEAADDEALSQLRRDGLAQAPLEPAGDAINLPPPATPRNVKNITKPRAANVDGERRVRSRRTQLTLTPNPKGSKVNSSLIGSDVNPWTLSKRPLDTLNAKISSKSRYSALGIYGSPSPRNSKANLADEPSDEVERSTPVSPTLSSDSLPSLSTIISPSIRKANERQNAVSTVSIDISSSPIEALEKLAEIRLSPTRSSNLPFAMPSSPVEASKSRKLIALRESLEGSWRAVEPLEAKAVYTKTLYDEVEAIDLTSSP